MPFMRPTLLATAALTLSLCLASLAAAAPASPGGARPAAKSCPSKSARLHAAPRCPAAKPAPKPFPKIIVTATLLPGSGVSVEIPALALPGGQVLIGTGVTRDVPMSGHVTGLLAHRFRFGQNIDVNFTSAQFRFGAVDILSDPACGGTPTLRINPASVVVLDKSKPSHSVLKYTGVSSATASVKVRLAFDMRTEPGCDKPLVTTGYAETLFTDNLSGKVGPRGLVALALQGAPTTLTIGACLYPGAPDKPCAGAAAGYPVKVSVHVVVRISLKAAK